MLLHGVMPAPAADPALRRRLEAEAAEHGREALHRRLAAVDPETAAAISPQDLVRTVRALEIWEGSGTTASAARRAHAFAPDRYPYALFVLQPEREALYRAIDERTRRMFEAGLVEEVRALVAAGYAETPPMRSVGYVQALAVVEGRMTREAAIDDTAQQTRRYAKRQLTWFKRERGARFLPPPYPDVLPD